MKDGRNLSGYSKVQIFSSLKISDKCYLEFGVCFFSFYAQKLLILGVGGQWRWQPCLLPVQLPALLHGCVKMLASQKWPSPSCSCLLVCPLRRQKTSTYRVRLWGQCLSHGREQCKGPAENYMRVKVNSLPLNRCLEVVVRKTGII